MTAAEKEGDEESEPNGRKSRRAEVRTLARSISQGALPGALSLFPLSQWPKVAFPGGKNYDSLISNGKQRPICAQKNEKKWKATEGIEPPSRESESHMLAITSRSHFIAVHTG